MITQEQKTQILELTTDWISQFPESSLISIKYSKNKRKLHKHQPKDKYTYVVIDFDTPDISKGRVMRFEIRVLDEKALEVINTVFDEQTESYRRIEAHKKVGFNPMSKEKSSKWKALYTPELNGESELSFA
jgi:hypothetical protein